jgi:hypothetical protein
MPKEPAQSHFNYNDRYGIRPRRAWLPYALALLIAGVIWTLWAGVHQAVPAISSKLLAFDNTDRRNIEIRYILNREDPSMSATCILSARDFDKVIVGQIIDRIPPSEGAVERAVTIPSRGDAVNASITTCYLD